MEGWISYGFSVDFGRIFMHFYAFIARVDSFGEGVETGNPLNTPMHLDRRNVRVTG